MTRSQRQDPSRRDAKQSRRRARLACRGAVAAALLAAVGGCWMGDRERRAPDDDQAVREVVRVGRYAIAGGTLYRAEDGALDPVAALPGGGPAADTLKRCVPSIPDLRAARFRRLTPSPDPEWTAWETVDAGGCVGVAGPAEPPVRVLGYWSGAVPDTVLWAPVGRFLALTLTHPGPRHSLVVFDAPAGKRLEMPWESECANSGNCDVARAAWLGGTLLNVEIRLGPAELPVPFEVNVAAAAFVGQTEEIQG